MKLAFAIILLSVLFIGCGQFESVNTLKDFNKRMADKVKGANEPPVVADVVTPTYKLSEDQTPTFDDDFDFKNLDLAIERQLERYRQRDLSGSISYGREVYKKSDVRDSLIEFQKIASETKDCIQQSVRQTCMQEFNKRLRAKFNIYTPKLTAADPRFGEKHDTFFTAYYTPTVKGSLDYDQQFYPHAIYRKPSDPQLREKSRVEIDFDHALAGKGLELIYAPDLFELYLLHVQGGGKVVYQDQGREKAFYISYDGTNKQSFTFISRYMEKMGYISNRSIDAQRNFLLNNPEKQREIYNTCPSYVYFKVSDHPPFGSDSVPLTDLRSIATDRNYYSFKGGLAFVKAKRPEKVGSSRMKSFSRFFLDQDTGGAIRGKARVDLYHGEDAYAEFAAYTTAVKGNLYFLMLKPN